MAETTSALCLACGLCCTGALHVAVEVKPEHLTLVRSIGLTVDAVEGGGGSFRQPCPLYRDNCCSVYAHRPPSCEDYQCALLKKHAAGGVELSAALALVDEVKALIAEGAARPLAAAARDPDALLRAAALDVVLEKHFREPPAAR